MNKTVIRFFTIADYEEEEIWLRKQHRSGWKLTGMTPPCIYRFESCEPEDVIYRLDFRNNERQEGEIFSDDESRVEQLNKVIKTRLFPIITLFFCAVMPSFLRMLDDEYVGPWGNAFSIFFSVVFILDLFLIVYCTVKIKKIRSRYKN